MSAASPGTVVLDIGKTNAKLTLIDAAGKTLAERRTPNTVRRDGPYPHHDTDRLWSWMLGELRGLSALAQIRAIVPVTHGATAALVDNAGLVLPVLDYEHVPGDATDAARYESLRPSFEESGSPQLPAGLNLGRQLDWLQARFPAEVARATHVLMYPQYWAWRFCGVAASEVTSLGCHTDLWRPRVARWSSLVERLGWEPLFPPRRDAWARLGKLRPELAADTGLPADCEIVCGIHDSNASLLRHLLTLQQSGPCTVLSTGTWVIAAALGSATRPLVEAQDMLANCDVFGDAVPCMRFMGGREFGAIAGARPAAFGQAEVEKLIAQRSLALPCFAETGGPLAGQAGRIAGPAPATPAEQAALATLYVVLMTDHCLNALGAEGRVVVEGAFTANPWFGPLLAGLREGRDVSVSDDSSGTTCGAWLLDAWGTAPEPAGEPVAALNPMGWRAYRDAWRTQAGAH
ncbi:sugar (pentulose or hexulose) kinase [Pelomonas saccharophila]|uniref:Sugar (Pentulose or hexulose) kinase n=1 Tax=Roseateles saccharophilus TaxID=304 RepID=A0ABU1YJD1_ROSSA|nr:FGGY family carbohydrate kinase [Roseateles saccharophilus]MDR7268954.1 sugar (pentulose or hexulose) kinase [Roseateles saccharophilus]